MAEMIKMPVAERVTMQSRVVSPWAPLGESLFRSLWIASVVSYTGTWMQNVGAGWLMTQMTMNPFMVGLVQAAGALPVFLVILPAGALADMVDRRRFLLVTQGWMVLASATLGILTLTSCVGPWVLLLFTFLLGLGSVMNDPAWQAITPELVPREQHASAVALNSAGFNVARAVGPALGGVIVAAVGCGTTFLLNAASFFGVILFLYRWKRPAESTGPARRVWSAMGDGFAYVRESALAKSVLLRTGTFSVAAASMLALMPIIARPYGARGYGVLLGCFGMGALIGAAALPRVRERLSVDGLVAFAIIVFAGMTFAAGRAQTFALLCVVMLVAGGAWIGILACLNVAAQTMCPSYLRARALSFYLLVLQGGMALGATLWGALAKRIGIPNALAVAALVLACGVMALRGHRIMASELELAPAVVRD
ncbi:MAG: MFS transporter [Candidatus Koribacter versatilis]|nr:MFS transporter [Candidatus Koribacter versatilis]